MNDFKKTELLDFCLISPTQQTCFAGDCDLCNSAFNMGVFHLPVCQVIYHLFIYSLFILLWYYNLGQFHLSVCQVRSPYFFFVYVFILFMFMFNCQKLKQVNTFFADLLSRYKNICLFISCFVEKHKSFEISFYAKSLPICLSSVRKEDATEWNFEKMLIRPWLGRIKEIPVTYSMKFQTTRSLCIKLMCTCVSCNMSIYKYQSTKSLFIFPTQKLDFFQGLLRVAHPRAWRVVHAPNTLGTTAGSKFSKQIRPGDRPCNGCRF